MGISVGEAHAVAQRGVSLLNTLCILCEHIPEQVVLPFLFDQQSFLWPLGLATHPRSVVCNHLY